MPRNEKLILRRVPPNCQFEVDNFEDVWLYKNKFDFVHGRELEGCIANEERLFEQAFEHLKPGGYFEISGAYAYFLSDDETHRKAESSALYLEQARAAGEKFGKSFEGVKTWKDKMSAAGFVNVTETVVKVGTLIPSGLNLSGDDVLIPR